jgi:hypothetical protein
VRYNCAVTGWFQHVIVDPGKLRLFCFLVFFIVAFLFIRFSVRMIRAEVKWWPGNVTPGGMHIHHMVFGLVFMCVGSVTGLAVQNPRSVWAAVTASVLGVGAGLVLDEFALVLHLEDVYWSEQGRLCDPAGPAGFGVGPVPLWRGQQEAGEGGSTGTPIRPASHRRHGLDRRPGRWPAGQAQRRARVSAQAIGITDKR